MLKAKGRINERGNVMRTLAKALVIVTIILVIFQLVGVISWSWSQVLSLLWMPLVAVISILLVCALAYAMAVGTGWVCNRVKRREDDL